MDWKDGLDHWHIHVQFLRAILQRADVLGEARSAERKPWPQVVRREVQLLVAAEHLHHLVAVDLELLAHISDFVRKAHFERVPRVARVLDHFRHADARAHERRVDRSVERDRAARVRGVVVADEGQRRLPEVFQRRAFAEELRVHRDAESFAVLLAGFTLECGDDHAVRRARQHRAAHDDDVVAVLVAQRAPHFLRYPFQVREIQAAVLPARCAHRQQRHVARHHGVCRVGRRPKPAASHALGEQIAQPRLDDRAVAAVDRSHLVAVDVHSNDRVSLGGKGRRRHAADISESEH